jgi:YHS domain-containing protein
MAKVRDPVCGMTVDAATAAGRSSFGDQIYYFCSKECLERFEADPPRYAAAAARGEASSPAVMSDEPRFTMKGGIVAPKFGSAGSGGAEYEGPPARAQPREEED